MAKYNYSIKVTEHMACAVLRGAPLSTKQGIEICNVLRGKSVQSAKRILNDVISLKRALPLKRFVGDVGHKPGMGPGRFPVKASEQILALVESVQANAQSKNLDVSRLVIKHISSQKASRPVRYGRQRGRLGKRTSIEIAVIEGPKVASTKKVENKKPVKAESKKADAKKPETTSAKTSDPAPKKAEAKPVKKETKTEEKKIEEKPKVETKTEEKVSKDNPQEEKSKGASQ